VAGRPDAFAVWVPSKFMGSPITAKSL
jgi:hypothetical protein